ncbi:phage tail family protein [Halalkalibacterium ligniniphilum]|uniref:phage tail family protein n=1 Tax=Halalkalibacterium ligniniphilum TaxID=1134413 RepID=UPI000349493C|nr:phage tail family protein [Halalkalibacterium ligniniphilum]
MERITFINSRGDQISFTNSVYKLITIEGFGDVVADIQTEKSPSQDGGTFIDAVLEERPISLELKIKGADYNEVVRNRNRMSSVMNPKLGLGKLKVETDEITKYIDCIADSVPYYPSGSRNRGVNWQRALVSLRCPDPYWKSDDITEQPTFEPLFQFPFEGEFEMGIQRDERIIINEGDAPAPLRIEFYGPAANPIITNVTTGEFIKVNRTLGEGEYMRIDTTDGRKSVEFVAPDGSVTNVFGWIDLDSTFFKLVMGENHIVYSADSDIQGAIVNISYRKLYAGV